jgi:hypothetical protein
MNIGELVPRCKGSPPVSHAWRSGVLAFWLVQLDEGTSRSPAQEIGLAREIVADDQAGVCQ